MAFDLTSEVSEIWRLEHELKLEMSLCNLRSHGW